MDPSAARDALSADPRLAALERDPTPALLVGEDGAVAWQNAAGRALGVGGRLDGPSARAVTAIDRAGLLSLRIGPAGQTDTAAFRASRVAFGSEASFVLLEALSDVSLSERGVSEIASQPAPALSGIAAQHEAKPDVAAGPRDDDRPPDPRNDLAPVTMAESPETVEVAAVHEHAPERTSPQRADAVQPNAVLARFVFEIDGEGRISFLSPDLAEAVGETARQAVGRLWVDVANDLGLDPSGAVAAAIGGRSGWSRLVVAWPRADGGRMRFALSAIPVFDRGRTFVGFRGLGASFQEPADCAEPRRAPETGARPLETTPDLTVTGAEKSGDLDSAQMATDGTAEPNDVAVPALSSVEESAFDEIARRLREAGEPPADEPSAREVWQDIAADAEIALGADEPAASVGPAHRADGARAEDLRRLLDRLTLGMLVLTDGDVVYANRAALDMSGHADLESLAARGADALFSEPLPQDDAAPAAVRLIAQDGIEIDVEARLSRVQWAGGRATAIALKRAEGASAALIAAHVREQELSAILDTATEGVLTLDGAGRILSINRSAEALFGYDAREVVGSLFSLALAPESRRVAFEYLDGLKSSSVASLLNDGREVLGLVRQGGAIPLYMTLGAIGSGEDGRYCAVLRDITHWKKAEEELIAAKRQAERASAQKSEFLAKVSHEIRTPLNAIIGFAEVMMEERFGAVGNERYKEYLKDIHLSGEHLISLVNDLIDLSKIESGKLELTFAEVDLNETVAQAVALLQPQANRAHIIIRTSLARSLPLVRADKRSIRQIVLNLASNAVKFTQGGGQVIVATALNDLGEPVIRVRDTGVGMSRKEIALALEPFRQLPMGGTDGAGLGLPLTKALAEANLADFAIQSAVGEGTLVEVTFSAQRPGPARRAE